MGMQVKQVMNHHQNNGLLNMIRTDPYSVIWNHGVGSPDHFSR